MTEERKSLLLEKILTASATEYVGADERRHLEDYDMIGVSLHILDVSGLFTAFFESQIEATPEVVVSYRPSEGHNHGYGTALIPKVKR